MAKKDEVIPEEATSEATPEPAEFPVNLDAFLGELPNGQGTMQDGFKFACRQYGISGHKYRSEWQALLTQYNNQPGDVPLRQQGGK